MTRVLMGRCRVRKLDDENFAGVGVDREMVELVVSCHLMEGWELE